MAVSVDAATRKQWIVIGISGVTCGGKTTLANRLVRALHPCLMFSQDHYFYPDDSPHHVRCPDMDHNNYDILSALDMKQFHQDVLETMQGRSKAHVSSAEPDAGAEDGGRLQIEGRKFLIVEGFTVLNYKPINELCDLRYYFVLSYEECISRRVLRLYEPADVAGYFERCVWPEHVQYRAEMEKDKRVKFFDGTSQTVLEDVLSDIRALPAARQ